ncbi:MULTISPECIES: hypothetical protein [unclassified Streptomyces]|uniref:hypothetical protein n=1 Tax=unclassified Streptomyces TaxID=2593676 RepID=UPI0016615F9D|nr:MULTISPECIES: hypothetical protein [unclassified Streptomyces]
MKRFVVVEAGLFPKVLRARCAGMTLSVRLSPAERLPCPPVAAPGPSVAAGRPSDVAAGPVVTPLAVSPSVLVGPSVVDEHLVVDVDACRSGSLLECADVLQGSRAHPVARALRRLSDLTAAHPTCGLAAVPLAVDGAGGASGWALAHGSDRPVVLIPHWPHQAHGFHQHHGPVRHHWPHWSSRPQRSRRSLEDHTLLPSCVHAWLVAGRSLREWPHATVARAA